MSSINYSFLSDSEATYIEIMRSFAKNYPNIVSDDQFDLLDREELFYKESNHSYDLTTVTAIEAVERAREFTMCRVKSFGFEHVEIAKRDNSSFEVKDYSACLLYDSHAYFSLIFEFTVEFNDDISENQILDKIFLNRDINYNLGVEEYVRFQRDMASKKIAEILEENSIVVKDREIKFTDDDTLPLIIFPVGFSVDVNLFNNEEVVKGLLDKSRLLLDYDQGFFHPGWNYTLVSGFPREVALNLVQLMIKAQSFYFSLTYLKSHYVKELNKTLMDKDKIEVYQVDLAEDVQLVFYSLVAQFKAYKNRLFPKYSYELSLLMERWNCDEDIENIKSYIDLDHKTKQRLHARKIEKQNEVQNKALSIIAAIQVVAIYGVVLDGISLWDSSLILFTVSSLVWVIALGVYWYFSKSKVLVMVWAVLMLLVSFFYFLNPLDLP
ncbi:MAG: hypothetical protein P1V33_00905 [Pseudohongiella nitratireducens]|nr:hypothetical protein [Pseudohongiella nitratireducens]MDF1622014.1 hypothetical protein [Pseudohongiella nitratireducens]